MRIISNYHDYYDSVQKTGQDQSVIYIRKKLDYLPIELDDIKEEHKKFVLKTIRIFANSHNMAADGQ